MPPKKILKIKKKLEKTSTPEESVFDIDIEKKAKTKVTDKVKKETTEKAKRETKATAKRETKATATEKEQSDSVTQEVRKGGLVSWNVAGFRAVCKKGFMDFMDSYQPDVLCLQEVKAKETDVKGVLDKLEAYPHRVWADSPKKAGYAGVALLSKRPFVKDGVRIGLGKEKHDGNGRIITVEYPDYYLVTSYVPNSGSKLVNLEYRTKEWNADFLDWIKKLQAGKGRAEIDGGSTGAVSFSKKKPVLVCGDLNVAHTEWDLKNDKSNWNKTAGFTEAECRGMDQLLQEGGLIDTFRVKKWSGVGVQEKGHYSYWSYFRNARANNSGWRIDYFLISKGVLEKRVKKSEILSSVMGSDHCPVRLFLE